MTHLLYHRPVDYTKAPHKIRPGSNNMDILLQTTNDSTRAWLSSLVTPSKPAVPHIYVPSTEVQHQRPRKMSSPIPVRAANLAAVMESWTTPEEPRLSFDNSSSSNASTASPRTPTSPIPFVTSPTAISVRSPRDRAAFSLRPVRTSIIAGLDPGVIDPNLLSPSPVDFPSSKWSPFEEEPRKVPEPTRGSFFGSRRLSNDKSDLLERRLQKFGLRSKSVERRSARRSPSPPLPSIPIPPLPPMPSPPPQQRTLRTSRSFSEMKIGKLFRKSKEVSPTSTSFTLNTNKSTPSLHSTRDVPKRTSGTSSKRPPLTISPPRQIVIPPNRMSPDVTKVLDCLSAVEEPTFDLLRDSLDSNTSDDVTLSLELLERVAVHAQRGRPLRGHRHL